MPVDFFRPHIPPPACLDARCFLLKFGKADNPPARRRESQGKTKPMEQQTPYTAETLWAACLEIVADIIQPQAFKTWFRPVKALELRGNTLIIQVPSQFFYEWIEEYYLELLSKTLHRLLGQAPRLEYNILMEGQPTHQHAPASVTLPGATAARPRNPENVMPLNIGADIRNPFIIPGLKRVNIDPQLKQTLTFDTFIEGDCNKLARSAGQAVAAKPGGTSFNPLLIYGAVGMGKTHLAHAIGNEVIRQFPDKKTVLYVSSEKFTNQFLDAVKQNKTNEFIHFYQLIDVLILDDVQFFANKEKTQDVFFHIFNHLHQNNKQLILTSDRPPKDLKDMQDRLLSRFKWGLSADLQSPDFETRIAILHQKMYADGIQLPADVVEFIAYNINTNVRELEGALISILAHANMRGGTIDIVLAKQVMKNFVKEVQEEITIEFIQHLVSDYFKLTIEDLKSASRKREVVQARQISMYFAKNHTSNTLKAIGKSFGGRDHSTVLHSCRTVNDLMTTDRRFKQHIEDLLKAMKNKTL